MISTRPAGAPVRVPQWAANTVWIIIALAYAAFLIADMYLDFQQVHVPCNGPSCNYIAISKAEFDTLQSWGLSPTFYAIYMLGLSALSVGISAFFAILIFWRQGKTAIGWVISLLLILLPITSIADSDNVGAAFPALLIPTTIMSVAGFLVLLSSIYLFPNGRFFPKAARYVWILNALTSTTSLLFFNDQVNRPEWVAPFDVLVFLGFLLLAGIFQIQRYRNAATAVERQQTKWILLGILITLAGFPVWFSVFAGGLELAPGQTRLLGNMAGWLLASITTTALPVSIAFAIQRYRIWDIDLVIRRTLQYLLLTGMIVLLYFGGVVGLQSILTPLIHENNSPLITVISTLAIAALFNPLRLSIQGFIDRRFYRARYDAEQALSEFSGAVRDEVDIDRLAGALLGVAQETIQPEHASLWIRGKNS